MQTAAFDRSCAHSGSRGEVERILDRIEDRVDGERQGIAFGGVVEALGERGFGPVFLVLGLLIVSPFGGIPTVPTIFAVVIAIVAVQMLRGGRRLALPGIVTGREVPAGPLARGVRWLRPWARWMDRTFGRRLEALTSTAAQRAAALAILALCLAVPPLELVPFAAVVPMFAIATFGLALTLRDGVVMLFAFVTSAVALIGAPALLLSQ